MPSRPSNSRHLRYNDYVELLKTVNSLIIELIEEFSCPQSCLDNVLRSRTVLRTVWVVALAGSWRTGLPGCVLRTYLLS